MRASLGVLLAVMACSHAHPVAPAAPKKVRLAVLPAESDAFPKAASAVTDSLVTAKVAGTDETQVSKVSLEVVQLSIECVDPSVACYQAAGRSLAADQLLFAELAAGDKPRTLAVTITLFDVATSSAKKTAKKEFASEAEAAKGVAALVAEVAQP